MLLVVSLGLTAALLFAVSASLQQHAAHLANRSLQQPRRDGGKSPWPAESNPDLPALAPLSALAGRLRRSRLWFAGWMINIIGFLVQGAALHLGSVALVQPLLITQLLFALPLTTWWSRRWPSRRAWLSGAAICGGVALFLAIRDAARLGGQPDRPRILLACLSAIVVIALLVRASMRRRPPVQAALIAVNAGMCFAISAALMKLTSEDLVQRGVGATAVDWPGYALAVSAVMGVLLGQWAFAAGSLPIAVAAMTITNPVASYLVGMLGFHVAPLTTAGELAAVAGAGALVSVGVAGISHSSIVRPTGGVQLTSDQGVRQTGDRTVRPTRDAGSWPIGVGATRPTWPAGDRKARLTGESGPAVVPEQDDRGSRSEHVHHQPQDGR